MVLGHPGAPLSNLQTKALLEELYKLSARPPVPTSTVVDPIDLSHTAKAKFVYVKVEDPSGLSPRFEGPYEIISRPSRSTISVRIGSFADGRPRVQEYNWNTCKIAHLRDDAVVGSRPKLGRPSKSPPQTHTTVRTEDPKPTDGPDASPQSFSKQTQNRATTNSQNHETSILQNRAPPSTAERGKIQMRDSSSREPHPDYVKKGPLITQEMYNKWTPDLLGIPPSTRPVRSTRNQNPQYVTSISI